MPTIPVDNPAALLRRDQVAEALTEAGFPIKTKTLATMATRGGGPIYRTFGRAVLYRWSDALAWAEGRLSAPRSTTAEGELNSRRAMQAVARPGQ